MKVLVLGGRGFIGRHAVKALVERGHDVTIGTRKSAKSTSPQVQYQVIALHKVERCIDWCDLVKPFDAVINCVGILRPRMGESYSTIHHWSPYRIAKACAVYSKRFIHVSALGLSDTAESDFIRSKLAGEFAIADTGADYSIVRPSILDGDGGFGAKWIRRVANWRWQLVPGDARGVLAPLAVTDLGEALARLAETKNELRYREVDLGGRDERTMSAYLIALRDESLPLPKQIVVPGWLVRAASHVCDALHITPLSWAHVQLMRRDNRPEINLLPQILGREPRRIGRLWIHPRSSVAGGARHHRARSGADLIPGTGSD